MKMVICHSCTDGFLLPLARWKECECGASGGCYRPDGDTAIVAGHCTLYGISNMVLVVGRAEAWRYDERNGKILRFPTPRAARDAIRRRDLLPERPSYEGRVVEGEAA